MMCTSNDTCTQSVSYFTGGGSSRAGCKHKNWTWGTSEDKRRITFHCLVVIILCFEFNFNFII